MAAEEFKNKIRKMCIGFQDKRIRGFGYEDLNLNKEFDLGYEDTIRGYEEYDTRNTICVSRKFDMRI
ncbi:hypothetical protein Pyn_35578 [Prunus yedoensis var. nudiflora]|uniref:Uncharacterized protein n=1 Tax=Prunus yedoensis var. nudiflora TaxID=2094558 RepID=A0A314ZFS9_PRUYE|nr:hypothetical protein Pyn_35578 [Prunus yedoensis var. nudiflora]